MVEEVNRQVAGGCACVLRRLDVWAECGEGVGKEN